MGDVSETETLDGRRPMRAAGPEPALVVVHPAPRVLGIPREGVVFGRESTCVLDDKHLSRAHLRVSRQGALTIAEDLGSKNGTFISGVRIQGARALAPNDVVRIGETVIVVDVDGAVEGDPGQAAFTGGSYAARTLRAEAARAARSGLTVLLRGATGSGKDVLARLIHAVSGRKPYRAVSCATIPETLVESTLFGQKRGAFTGAETGDGWFVAAHGGTLFLDEVAELRPSAQAALLRVLEDGQVVAVGSTSPRAVDVRVIAASHVDLADAVRTGRFRDDLFQRLAGWPLRVPALAERRADVLALARATLTADAAEALILAEWPGNVRELLTTVARAAAFGTPIDLDALPAPIADRVRHRGTTPAAPAKVSAYDRPSRDELLDAFERFHSIAAVARHFDRDRTQIKRWMALYDLVKE